MFPKHSCRTANHSELDGKNKTRVCGGVVATRRTEAAFRGVRAFLVRAGWSCVSTSRFEDKE